MTYAKAEFESIHGKIVSDWKIENGQFRLNVVIPANTTADVFVPAASAGAVKESGKLAAQAQAVKFVQVVDGCARFEVGSGSYQFSADISGP